MKLRPLWHLVTKPSLETHPFRLLELIIENYEGKMISIGGFPFLPRIVRRATPISLVDRRVVSYYPLRREKFRIETEEWDAQFERDEIVWMLRTKQAREHGEYLTRIRLKNGLLVKLHDNCHDIGEGWADDDAYYPGYIRIPGIESVMCAAKGCRHPMDKDAFKE